MDSRALGYGNRHGPVSRDGDLRSIACAFNTTISRKDLLIGSMAGAAAVGALAVLDQRPWSKLTPQSSAAAATTRTATALPANIAALEANHFIPLVGERFQVATASEEAMLVLRDIVVAEPDRAARPRRVRAGGFSLLFEVTDGSLTGSGIVGTSHERIGRHELFLHRVGLEDGTATLYEAVFN